MIFPLIYVITIVLFLFPEGTWRIEPDNGTHFEGIGRTEPSNVTSVEGKIR